MITFVWIMLRCHPPDIPLCLQAMWMTYSYFMRVLCGVLDRVDHALGFTWYVLQNEDSHLDQPTNVIICAIGCRRTR